MQNVDYSFRKTGVFPIFHRNLKNLLTYFGYPESDIPKVFFWLSRDGILSYCVRIAPMYRSAYLKSRNRKPASVAANLILWRLRVTCGCPAASQAVLPVTPMYYWPLVFGISSIGAVVNHVSIPDVGSRHQ